MVEKDFVQRWTEVDSFESSPHLHTQGQLCLSTPAVLIQRLLRRILMRKKKKRTRRPFEHASAQNGPMRQLMVVET